MPVCLSLCLSFCLPVCLFACLPVRLSICISFSLSFFLSVFSFYANLFLSFFLSFLLSSLLPLPLSLSLLSLSFCFFVCLFLSSVLSLYPFCYLFPKVIGDKQGGNTALALAELGNLNVLEEINRVVQVPMKFIHVHRNPFDNIATMMLRATGARDAVRKEGVKVRRLWCFCHWSSCSLKG